MNPSGVLENDLKLSNLTLNLPKKWGGVKLSITIDACGRVVIVAPEGWDYQRYSAGGIAQFIVGASSMSPLLRGRGVDAIKVVLKDPALASCRWPVLWQGPDYFRPGAFRKRKKPVEVTTSAVMSVEAGVGATGGFGLVRNLSDYNTGSRAFANHGHR